MSGADRPAVVLPPLWDDLLFLSPMSSDRADALAGWVADGLREGGTVLDVGCGWAELLLRVLAGAPTARGRGRGRVRRGAGPPRTRPSGPGWRGR